MIIKAKTMILSLSLVFISGVLLPLLGLYFPSYLAFMVSWVLVFMGLLLLSRPILVLSLIAGILWSYSSIETVDPVQKEIADVRQTISAQVKIVGLPVADQYKLRFIARLQAPVSLFDDGDLLQLDWFGPTPVVQAGDIWEVEFAISQWQKVQTSNHVVIQTPLLRRGVAAKGQVRRAVLLRQQPTIVDDLHRLRFAIAEQLTIRLQHQPLSGLVSALGLGERSGITDDQWDVLNETGTTHLMAISGLHVGLFAGWVFVLFQISGRFLLRWFPTLAVQSMSAFAAIVGAVVYAALAGFSVPTQRALVMCILVFGMLVSRRRVSAPDIMALALMAVLLIDPLALLAPGFYLSFSAVFGIFWLMLYRQGRPHWLISVMKVQLALSILMLPLIFLLFERISWVSPVANIVAIPWVSWLVVPLAILSVLLGLFNPTWAVWPADLAANMMQPVWVLLQWLAEFNSVSSPMPPFSDAGFTLSLLLAVVLFTVPRGLPGRGIAGLLLLPWMGSLLWPSLLL